jgi:hypothetical protein
MISYCIQGVVAFVLGPALALLAMFLDRNSNTDSYFETDSPKWLVKYLYSLSQSQHQANILITLSVLMASVIRISQLTPLGELNYIFLLAIYKFIVITASFISYAIVQEPSRAKVRVLTFVAVIVFALFMTAIFMRKKYPTSEEIILEQLRAFCVLERDYPMSEVDFESDSGSLIIWGITYLLLFVGIVTLTSLIWWNFIEKILNIYRFIYRQYSAFCRLIHVRPKRFAALSIGGSYTVMCIYLLTVLLIYMEEQRKELQRASGPAYQDAEWGFGQIAALVLWAPFVHESVLIAIGTSIVYMIS